VNVGGRPWNPLAQGGRPAAGSCYAAWDGTAVRHLLEPQRAASPDLFAWHSGLRDLILSDGYPCVGSRSVVNRLTYRFGLYSALGSDDAVAALCHDLYEFNHEFARIGDEFVSFIAGFDEGGVDSEMAFERALWGHLQAMHEVDRRRFDWDPKVQRDPAHPEFSFSIGGRGFFVVGLHPEASRKARRTQRPTIVFNAHEQFEALRRRGKFELMKQMIRARDLSYQGSINPVLENFGTNSEARQYSGRAVPSDWACPFHPKTRED
jgi:uncharacterized protein